MNPLEAIAVALIVIALAAHGWIIFVAVRSSLRGRPAARIGTAVFASFGVLVLGVGLLIVAVDLVIARVLGAVVVLTGLAVIALSTRVRPRMRGK